VSLLTALAASSLYPQALKRQLEPIYSRVFR
jgi:hypothetical protein